MQISAGVFLVTGGASGLGEATVRLIAANGGKVAIADLNRDAGTALAAELGSGVTFVETDVAAEDSVQATIDSAKAAFPGAPLIGAVNCAGIGVPEKILGKQGPHRLALFEKTLRVNLTGTFNVVRLCSAAMAENAPTSGGERGVIVCTASVAAFEGQIGQAAYSASKGGVVGMTLPVAREMARLGIRVVTVAPGLFETPMLAGLPEAAKASLGKQVPFPSRLGRPGEYAALVRHIVENEMLNGCVIRLDGAIRMTPQ